jgi:GNAT superfamily N-acetyltransferase
MNETELHESNAQFIDAWEFWTRRSRAGEVRSLPGLEIRWMGATWPICNLTFLANPVEDEADLARRIEAAVSHAGTRHLPWLFFLCTNWLPEDLRGSAEPLFARHGLVPVVPMTGMVTDDLLPPRRPLPELEFRPVRDAESRRAAGEINCIGYGMPVEWGHEALDIEAMWNDERAFGYLGLLDGRPVTTAKTVAVDDRLYVGLVATLPEHQKQGYGEAVMRHSLEKAREATGQRRTVLHATPMGFPLYREMGYRTAAHFVAYSAPHE